uniref:Auxin response factor n=1 Tax=Rhizophora mucronata TaxID=61149 RepID=A0A2P2NKL3_RHIMU
MPCIVILALMIHRSC